MDALRHAVRSSASGGAGRGRRHGARRAWRALLVLLLALMARALAAQQPGGAVSGRVVDTDGAPVPFAGVALVNDRGERRDGTADGQGRFRLPLPAGGAWSLEARMIGFRPLRRPLDAARDAAAPVELPLERLAFALQDLVAQPSCIDPARESETAGLVLGQVAEHAGRLARAMRDHPFRLPLFRTVRLALAPADTLRDEVQEIEDWTRRPAYRKGGVLVREGGVWRFLLPQLTDIASPAFRATHCFTLAGVERLGETETVRVDYRPVAGLRDADVEGSFWLDRTTFELLRSSARLVVPTRPRNLEVETLETIADWGLAPGRFAIPLTVRAEQRMVAGQARYAVRVSGREEERPLLARLEELRFLEPVFTATSPASDAFDVRASGDREPPSPVAADTSRAAGADGAALRGTVALADGAPVAGALVVVIGTDHAAVTDASGAFRLPMLPAGGYTLFTRDAEGREYRRELAWRGGAAPAPVTILLDAR